MNDREKWRETVRDIRAGGATWWWWWYIYIYIYIYILSSTDKFVVSQLFSEAIHARCFKSRSKPGWLYIRYLTPRDIVIVCEFFVYILHKRYRRPGVLNSWEELMRFSLCWSIMKPDVPLHAKISWYLLLLELKGLLLYRRNKIFF